jgi:hypothetical protein
VHVAGQFGELIGGLETLAADAQITIVVKSALAGGESRIKAVRKSVDYFKAARGRTRLRPARHAPKCIRDAFAPSR